MKPRTSREVGEDAGGERRRRWLLCSLDAGFMVCARSKLSFALAGRPGSEGHQLRLSPTLERPQATRSQPTRGLSRAACLWCGGRCGRLGRQWCGAQIEGMRGRVGTVDGRVKMVRDCRLRATSQTEAVRVHPGTFWKVSGTDSAPVMIGVPCSKSPPWRPGRGRVP